MAQALSKKPVPGATDIRKYRVEIVAKLAEILKEVLKSQGPISKTEQGEERYRNARISGEVAKRLPKELVVVRSTNPLYTADYWLMEACRKLGYEARIEWERTQDGNRPFLYLKEKVILPPVIRNITPESTDDIPF
jgi:hypothetical protein